MQTETSKLMFDFEASETIKEDIENFVKKDNLMEIVKKCSVEAVGTYFLCSTIALAGGADFGALAIGLCLTVMIFAFGHISGGHFNPAVTLAVWLRGNVANSNEKQRIGYLQAVTYMVSQVVGALIGAAQQKAVLEDYYTKSDVTAVTIAGTSTTTAYPSVNVEWGTAVLTEAIFTFALAIVVLNVATTKSQSQNSFFGLAIGMTLTAGAVAVGDITGAAFNPAVGFALPAVHDKYDDLTVYLVGPFLGAVLAAAFFRFTADSKEFEGEKKES